MHNLRKRSCTSPGSDTVDESSSHKSQRRYESSTEQLVEFETVPLLVLPTPEVTSASATCDLSQTDQRSSEHCDDEEQSGSLVDKLISDLVCCCNHRCMLGNCYGRYTN